MYLYKTLQKIIMDTDAELTIHSETFLPLIGAIPLIIHE